MRTKNLRSKLYRNFFFVAIIPLLVVVALGYWQGTKFVSRHNEKLMISVAATKEQALQSYLKGFGNSLADFAASASTLDTTEELESAYEKLDGGSTDVSGMREKIRGYWDQDFASGGANNIARGTGVALFQKLDSKSVAGQYDFIASNRFPVGQKFELETSNRETTYSRTHRQAHVQFREFLSRYHLHDLYVVSAAGRVIYSVRKNLDFATDLFDGPWADTSLSKAFEASKAMDAGQIHFEDFSHYTPSQKTVAFVSTPLHRRGTYVGSLIVQMPAQNITEALAARAGLGQKGESFLVASDRRLRSDTYRNTEAFNVERAFDPASALKLQTIAIENAFAGKTGVAQYTTYDGQKVIGSFVPVKVFNQNWALITEVPLKEVQGEIMLLSWAALAVAGAAALVIAALAALRSSAIVKTLKKFKGLKNLLRFVGFEIQVTADEEALDVPNMRVSSLVSDRIVSFSDFKKKPGENLENRHEPAVAQKKSS